MDNSQNGRLNSWKEIAAHLDRDVSTVRRWERERGMPVHRVPGGGSASVFAWAHELDAWLTHEDRSDLLSAGPPNGATVPVANHVPASQPRPARALRFGGVATLALLAVLAAGAAWIWWPGGRRPIVRLELAAHTVSAIDDRGAVRWTYALPARAGAILHASSGDWTIISDPDKDGRQFLAAAVEQVSESGVNEGTLFAFDAEGRLRWQSRAQGEVTFAAGTFGPPWSAGGTVPARVLVDGRTHVVWPVHHRTWWPGQLLLLDDTGQVRGRFVNAGWIGTVEASPDQRFVLASGVSNSAGAHVLAVLDARHISGASPEGDQSPYRCLDCAAGGPYRYVVFPRSPVSLASGLPLRPPALIVSDRGFELRILESAEPPHAESIYEFSWDFTLLRASRSDAYAEREQRVLRDGAPPGSADAPTEDAAVSVRLWDAARGWTVMAPVESGATPVRRGSQ